jgi:hypothetical protein
MVPDQFAAAESENGRTPDQACSLLLLFIVGGEPSHATLAWKHAATDGGFAAAGRIDAAARRNQSERWRGVEEEVPEK